MAKTYRMSRTARLINWPLFRVLRNYITEIRVTRPYFDAGPSSTDEELAAKLPRHPVLRLVPR